MLMVLRGLKVFKLRRGNIMLVMMLMNTEEKRYNLMTFMTNSPNATEAEIIEEAYKIAKI